jgi:hypothetical protein
MDGNPQAFYWEALKACYTFWLIQNQEGWFGAEKFFSLIPSIIIVLQIIGLMVSFYFSGIYRKTSLD